ncbi:MAG TPA: hypothetical protein VG889_17840 [Rhizomicrobium sp.]|nr:hypothetical protein [Rhizomicrobium sp.]
MEGLDFDHREKPPLALIVFTLCVAVLLGPSLLVWIVRGVGFAAQCAPGAELCRGMQLGGGLRDALALAWSVGTDILLTIVLSVIAAVACFAARRPLMGALALVLLPILTPVLPMLAVYVSRYDGCEINPDGIGTCMLWGARMGRSFHTAATVPDMIYGFVPYSFAVALVVSIIGWFLSRPKPEAPLHATARIRRFED